METSATNLTQLFVLFLVECATTSLTLCLCCTRAQFYISMHNTECGVMDG